MKKCDKCEIDYPVAELGSVLLPVRASVVGKMLNKNNMSGYLCKSCRNLLVKYLALMTEPEAIKKSSTERLLSIIEIEEFPKEEVRLYKEAIEEMFGQLEPEVLKKVNEFLGRVE